MKRMMLITLILLLFISCSGVHAENSTGDAITADNMSFDGNYEMDSSEPILGKSLDAGDLDELNSFETGDSLLEDAEEGEYVDASEAYGYLNAFRTEENVWYWNSDDATQSHVNTNDTVWLKPLLRDVELENTAKIRAKEIAVLFSHVRPNGNFCFEIFPDGLLDYGENIAKGYEDCFEVTEGWKETNESYSGQGHRRTMLQADFNYVGIAGYKINDTIYWVQNFGCRYDPKDVSADSKFKAENNTANPTFGVEVPKYASGIFEVYVNGTLIDSKSLSNGKSVITVCGLNSGKYEIFLSYSGDYNCNPINRTETVTIPDHENPATLTFNDLNTLIRMGGSEIQLQSDYAFSEDTDSSFTQGIEIPKYLTIDGQGHVIDAKNAARIFKANSFDVTLKNLCLINANANFPRDDKYYDGSSYGVTCLYNAMPERNGGVIFAYSRLSIVNCTFSNNAAFNGGAVYAYSYLDVENSTFSLNSAGYNGGAIYSEYDVNLKNVSLTGNHALDFGAAVYTPATLEATDSIFEDNNNFPIQARQFINNNNVIITDEYMDVFANASVDNGIVTLDRNYDATGTVLINASNVTVDGRGYTIDAKGKSRVFYITGDNVTVKNLNFKNAKAINYGGAIYDLSYHLKVINSTFTDNVAESGGAIYGNLTEITVINSSFTNNSAKDFLENAMALGGAICTENGTVSIENSRFITNTAYDGGAVRADYGTISIMNSYFENNSAIVYGGGAVSNGADVNVTSSTFKGNYAERYGGAVFCYETSRTIIADSTFENNTSHHYGGAVSAAVWAEITNSTFTRNFASDHGAAISIWGNLSVADSNFTCNSAEIAGAIFDYSESSTVSIARSNFINNTQKNFGVLYLTNNAFVTDSLFLNNHAYDGVGGAITSFQNLTVSNSIFKNNSAARSLGFSVGGAIVNYGENLFVMHSIFEDSSAYLGGAVANFEGNASIDDSIFINNSAAMGGAVYNHQKSDLFASNSIFENNSAQDGAAMYLGDAFNCTFTGNDASNVASAMYGASNTAEKCTFTKNIDHIEGPTFDVTVTDCTFKDNRLILKAYFESYYMQSSYYQGDTLFMYVNSYTDYTRLSNVTATLRAFKNDELVGEFEYLSSDGWTVNITEGNYTFCFSVENQDYEVDCQNISVTVFKKEIADLNISVESGTYPDLPIAEITSNLDGFITMYIDGYYMDTLDVKANEKVKTAFNYLWAGNHTLNVTMVPANYHFESRTFTQNFTILKKPTFISVDVDNVTEGENVFVRVNVSDAGNVNIRVGSVEQSTYAWPDDETQVYMGVFNGGTYVVEVTLSVDENYVPSSASKALTVFRQVTGYEIAVYQNASDIIIKLPEGLEGNVTLSLAGENYTVNVNNGTARVEISPLDNGTYSYVLTYAGGDVYAGFILGGEVDIIQTVKVTPEMEVSQFKNGASQVRLPSDATGTVTLTINNGEYVFDVISGVADVILPELANGNYPYTITYSGDGKYSSFTSSGSLNVNNSDVSGNGTSDNGTSGNGTSGNGTSGNGTSGNQTSGNGTVVPEIIIPSLDNPSDGVVQVSLPSDATGTVTLTVNGNDYTFDVKDGSADVKIPDIDDGNYEYTITYSGDGKYSSFTSGGVLKVNNTLPHALLIPDVRMPNLNEGLDDGYVIVTVPGDVKATVTLSIFAKTYVFDVVDGKANVTLPDLADGDYEYSITYFPTSKYANYTDIGILRVNRTSGNSSDGKTVPEIVIPPLDGPSADGSVMVSLPADATGKVILTINGSDYEFAVENGAARIIIPNLGDGDYPYTITYSGDGRYSSFTNNGTLSKESPKVDPVIRASNVKVTYSAGSYYTIRVNGTDGKPADGANVLITVKGKVFKTLTTTNGVAKFKVTNVPGSYNMTITALGKSITRTLTVKHLVTLKSVTVKKSAKKLVLQATLAKIKGKYLNKKTVTFKFNGKTYKTKTNEKGVAKVTINSNVLKKLKVGKKVTYQATYSKDTVKKTVKIKK